MLGAGLRTPAPTPRRAPEGPRAPTASLRADATWRECSPRARPGQGLPLARRMRRSRSLLLAGWILSVGTALGMRAWNAIAGRAFYGYDAWGHIAYVFFLDMYRAVPFADQAGRTSTRRSTTCWAGSSCSLATPDVLVVGLSLLGSAASLGVAALAAGLVRAGFPGRPGLALLAFTATAFVPVHVYVSPMPGNEMTATFFASAAVYAHLRNEMRSAPDWRRGPAHGRARRRRAAVEVQRAGSLPGHRRHDALALRVRVGAALLADAPARAAAARRGARSARAGARRPLLRAQSGRVRNAGEDQLRLPGRGQHPGRPAAGRAFRSPTSSMSRRASSRTRAPTRPTCCDRSGPTRT